MSPRILKRILVGVALLLVCVVGVMVAGGLRADSEKARIDSLCERLNTGTNILKMEAPDPMFHQDFQALREVAMETCHRERQPVFQFAFSRLLSLRGVYSCTVKIDGCTGSVLESPKTQLVAPNE